MLVDADDSTIQSGTTSSSADCNPSDSNEAPSAETPASSEEPGAADESQEEFLSPLPAHKKGKGKLRFAARRAAFEPGRPSSNY